MVWIRRFNVWSDERGEQYDEDFFTYSFVPNATNVTGGISGTLAPGASAICPVNIQQDSAFEWNFSTSSASDNASDATFAARANINIQITDTAAGRNLFNEPLPIGLVSGDGQFPYVVPFPRRFMPKGSIIVTMTNFDTAKTYKNVQFNMIGRKLFMRPGSQPLLRFKSWRDPDTGAILAEDFFVYHFGFGSVANGVSAQVQQVIENDSDFEARLLSAQNNAALNTGASTNMQAENQIQILDGGSQRLLSNVPIIGPTYFGNLGTPLIMPVPRIFLARTNVTLTLANNTAATTIAQTDVAIAGRKIFEFGA